MKLFVLFFIILSLFPIATTIECDELTQNNELCYEIKNSGITQEEKEYLMNSLIVDEKSHPNHKFVSDWNLKIDPSFPLPNTRYSNSLYIKNAWVKIFSIMPSILENNQTWNNGSGEIFTGFNYNIVLPANYNPRNYPETSSGYCRIYYNLESSSNELKIYNNNYVGSGHLIKFSSSSDMNLEAEYTIEVNVKIDKYEWYKYCARSKNGKCKEWAYACNYKTSEIKQDKLTLTDTKFIKYYPTILKAELKVKDKYKDSTKFNLKTSNFTNLNLKFINSEYDKNNYIYSIIENNSLLQIQAIKQSNEYVNNLFIDNKDLIVKNIQNCKLTLFDHFSKKEFNCNLDYNEEEVKIITDKLVYNENETIKVTIEPSDKEFNVTYGSNSKVSKGNAEFVAKYSVNKISLESDGKTIEKIVHVKNEAPLNMLFILSIFGGVNFIITSLIKKYWGFEYG